ncbi:MAG: hybrid sensor histidine kinase/response regulator [Vicinamibacterales bacterium]
MRDALPPEPGIVQQRRPSIADRRKGSSQQFVQDLTCLLALPAYWAGSDPAFIIRTLFTALESLLPIEVCYGIATGAPAEQGPILRVAQRPVAALDQSWTAVVDFAAVVPNAIATSAFTFGDRELHWVRLPTGGAGDAGCVIVGSPQPLFPDPAQTAILRLASTLAAAALATARALRERDDAQRAKDEFLAVLGHELRNPLAPIVTAMQLMRMKAGGQPSREQEIIERQVQHLRNLVDDLLDVSKITKGHIELRLARVDVAEVIALALETVAPLMQARQHAVNVRVGEGLLLEADQSRLIQVVGNLLTNAAKHTPPKGRVDIEADARDGWITIRVCDTGAGLSAELLPGVFDLFVQGRQSLARPAGGLGIGLAIVKRLVEGHGGTVSAQSAGPGLGSEFTVRLPVAGWPAARPADSTDCAGFAKDPMSSARVLLVDDNEDAAELAKSVLCAAGHHVDVVHTGLQAIHRAGEVAFDLIVLDIGLPDFDGYAVADKLKSQFSAACPQVIAMTGYGLPHNHRRSADAGFAAHLVKPVDPDRLAEVVQSVFDARRLATDGSALDLPT